MFDQLHNYRTYILLKKCPLLFAVPSILFNRSKDCFCYNKLNLKLQRICSCSAPFYQGCIYTCLYIYMPKLSRLSVLSRNCSNVLEMFKMYRHRSLQVLYLKINKQQIKLLFVCIITKTITLPMLSDLLSYIIRLCST